VPTDRSDGKQLLHWMVPLMAGWQASRTAVIVIRSYIVNPLIINRAEGHPGGAQPAEKE
jgi:hypothetical protein